MQGITTRVALVTLGCDKNTVDSERYLAALVAQGAEPVESLDEADVILVNTCGFIDAAKKESIDALVSAGRLRSEGSCKAVVALGCMVQRHKAELEEALPEVDLFLGSSEVDALLPSLVEQGLLNEAPPLHPGDRLYTGDLPHVRYLKISEGCDHGCAFCAIPLMRGRHRSFALPEVVREAQLLEMQGAREVNLVAQDLAHWGRDIRDGRGLPDLLESLLHETEIPWIRMLYLYSAGITPRLLQVVADSGGRVVPYIDMPIQHASDSVLARMRRPERRRTISEKLARFRDAVPNVTIRTTCIVGFPGETDEDFETLLEFLEEARFDRVGAFTYSPQEGTRAYDLPDDVPDAIKMERLERLTSLQRVITAERYERHLGTVARLLVDRPAEEGEGLAQARAPWQADDVDGVTWVSTDAAPGSFVEAAIHDVEDYDFHASAISVVMPPPVRSAPAKRSLPVVGAGSMGSFGR
ncbi:MAG TPA: 30S ribosomal protein S12 methylthiotransferase RimO [Gemmatimonadales bacterium]|nr:30S ribosomal protein S12 methylthiotransferase RimO [Gemmatimonadales bacterium]